MELPDISRRTFVATTAVAAGGAAVGLGVAAGAQPADALTPAEPLGGSWVRTTCSPNCTGACGIEAWAEDGQVRLVRQAADYPYEHYNPRGCLKGLSFNTI